MLLLLLLSGGLFSEIMKSDTRLFETGFNQCQISVFEELLTNDFEFYHDRGGPSDKKGFIHDTQKNICSGSNTVTRIHISSNVYPLYSGDTLYAALQEGIHAFAENGKVGGYARFSHLWKKEKENWKLARSYSYSHGPIEDHITALMKEHRIPILGLAVLKNKEVSSSYLLGSKDKKRFNVASLSKAVTAVIALKMVENGTLNFDEPVFSYWTDPDVKEDPRSKRLTARHLLSHQSGFPNWRQDKLSFTFEPGTAYGYSGEGMEYLRKVIETKTGKSWEKICPDLLFTPLKMENTGWNVEGAVPAFRADESPYPALPSVHTNAADDLYTTVEDYAQFLSHLLKGAGVNEAHFKEFLEEQVTTTSGKFFALGLEGYSLPGKDPVYAHGGSDAGSRCIFFIHPRTGEGLLLLSSSDNGHELYAPIVELFWQDMGKEIIRIEMQ
jgi:CubicO group peptidase (beta-lactamase class C family)